MFKEFYQKTISMLRISHKFYLSALIFFIFQIHLEIFEKFIKSVAYWNQVEYCILDYLLDEIRWFSMHIEFMVNLGLPCFLKVFAFLKVFWRLKHFKRLCFFIYLIKKMFKNININPELFWTPVRIIR